MLINNTSYTEPMTNRMPKTIWFLWLQGIERAPALVKKCHNSWEHHNTNWNIVLLDETNINNYVDLASIIHPNKNITPQALSDIIRVNLLARYGGVWVDATCFCNCPLDAWLNEHSKSGFFAFYRPGRDRLISTWFIAATQDCYLTSKWRDNVNKYWRLNSLSPTRKNLALEKLSRLFNRNVRTTRYWFSFPVRNIIKIYPYFWVHYLFSLTVQKDSRCMRVWNQTKRRSAKGPRLLKRAGLLNPLRDEIKDDIDNRRNPVYKLHWKQTENLQIDGSVLHYLFETIPTKVKIANYPNENPDDAQTVRA